MKKEDLLRSYVQEMRRGNIIMCVLAKLKEEKYGYNLISEMDSLGIPIEANTLYPLLRRLEAQGLLISSWNTSDDSKPRKYYHTTELGNQLCEELKIYWQQSVVNIYKIMGE